MTGKITVEGGGQLKATNVKISTDILNVDKLGTLTVSGKGLRLGDGVGSSYAGGSFGGLGGNGYYGNNFETIT